MESGANHPLHPSIGGAQPARKRFARELMRKSVPRLGSKHPECTGEREKSAN